jgi:hypothetical protein
MLVIIRIWKTIPEGFTRLKKGKLLSRKAERNMMKMLINAFPIITVASSSSGSDNKRSTLSDLLLFIFSSLAISSVLREKKADSEPERIADPISSMMISDSNAMISGVSKP